MIFQFNRKILSRHVKLIYFSTSYNLSSCKSILLQQQQIIALVKSNFWFYLLVIKSDWKLNLLYNVKVSMAQLYKINWSYLQVEQVYKLLSIDFKLVYITQYNASIYTTFSLYMCVLPCVSIKRKRYKVVHVCRKSKHLTIWTC